jgi:hypothetical protein
MTESFVNFINSLPDKQLMALAKPIGNSRERDAVVQIVLDKFGNLGWEHLLGRLTTATLQVIGNELAVEHDDRETLLKTIPQKVSGQTHETLASFSAGLVEAMWRDLEIKYTPDLETLVLELFIGGIEAIIGIWTIPQMNEVIDLYQIPSRNMKLKEEIVFDIVKSILDQSYVTPALPEAKSSHIPQTPRSPIRPVDDRPRRRNMKAAQSSVKVEASQTMVEDKENVENDLSSAVAQLKFEPISRPRRGRAQQNM